MYSIFHETEICLHCYALNFVSVSLFLETSGIGIYFLMKNSTRILKSPVLRHGATLAFVACLTEAQVASTVYNSNPNELIGRHFRFKYSIYLSRLGVTQIAIRYSAKEFYVK